jgi:two-component system, NarL family, nitrate/nitrite response regulator NarL
MSERIRVAVVDDHPLFRAGVVMALEDGGDLEVVAQGGTAQDAIRIAQSKVADIMLLDVGIPGCGIAAAEEIGRTCAGMKTVMLTASESAADVTTALQNGVRGYVLKGCGGSELLAVIRAISNDETYITPSLATRLLVQPKGPSADEPTLTMRESQVLQLLTQGKMNKEIAQTLELTEKTVKHYMTILMQKLQVRNRVEAVLVARRLGGGQHAEAPGRR